MLFTLAAAPLLTSSLPPVYSQAAKLFKASGGFFGLHVGNSAAFALSTSCPCYDADTWAWRQCGALLLFPAQVIVSTLLPEGNVPLLYGGFFYLTLLFFKLVIDLGGVASADRVIVCIFISSLVFLRIGYMLSFQGDNLPLTDLSPF